MNDLLSCKLCLLRIYLINLYKQAMGCISASSLDHRLTWQKTNPTVTLSEMEALFVNNQSIIVKYQGYSQIISYLMSSIAQRLNQRYISGLKLIFRASEYGFKISQFRKLCHQKQNTILIACTKDDKYFGAFTPCKWKNDQTLTYESDGNAVSFLFKFCDQKIIFYDLKQQQKQFAILNDSDCGPVFGRGHDIIIVDQCYKKQSWNNLGKSYGTGFRYGSVKANTQLCGCQKYTLKQYQIWRLETNQVNIQ